jgi:catechol 2,3-dioxygenase-like lactoylglutathione lyase family enzyme
MQAKASLSSFTFNSPTPELPVRDVERAQAWYRDKLGFQVGWLHAGGEIGAVNRDRATIFFRRRGGDFEPAVHWIYAPDIEVMHDGLLAAGANITEPLAKMPWGLTQFTLEDLDGNRFYFHRD